MFLLLMKKISWKTQNVILVSCYDIDDSKLMDQNIYQDHLFTRSKLIKLYRIINFNKIENAENTLKTSLNKKEDGKLFISAYRTYYEHEHELIELAKHSKEV